MADLKAMREANWWDDPWIPVRVDTLRALLDCAEASQRLVNSLTFILSAKMTSGKRKELQSIIDELEPALAALEKAP